jgi:hypothetical protein
VKEDAPTPPRPPRKRRQMERALPVWLATWATDESLTPSERRRAQEERDRRKALQPEVVVGFVGAREGLSPGQRARVRELLAGATEAHHGDGLGGDAQFHEIAGELGVPVVLHPPLGRRAFSKAERQFRAEPPADRTKAIVRQVNGAGALLVAPREGREPERVGEGTPWAAVRYARDRGCRVRVVMPDGELLGEEVRSG